MELSKAIREGIKKVPIQCYGAYFGVDPESACVLGTAVIGALGSRPMTPITSALKSCFQRASDSDENLICPAGCGAKCFPVTMGYHLNDDHTWSRERIADWYASNGF